MPTQEIVLRIKGDSKDAQNALSDVAKALNKVDSSKAESEFSRVSSSADKHSAKTRSALSTIGVKVEDVGDKVAHLGVNLASLGLKTGAAGIGAGLAALGGIGLLAIDAAAKWEQYGVILGNVLAGGEAQAKQMLSWLGDFAKQTPYELDEVVQAAVKLSAYGIDATGVLQTLGDTASSMGKGLNEAVEALADAQTGEFERLKEFGLKALDLGNLSKEQLAKIPAEIQATGNTAVMYTDKTGKEQIAVVDRNNREMVSKTMLGIWNSRYEGGMEKLSHTWVGVWSNIKDGISANLRSIGQIFLPHLEEWGTQLTTWMGTTLNPAIQTESTRIADIWAGPGSFKEKMQAGWDTFDDFLVDLGLSKGTADDVKKKFEEIGGAVQTTFETVKAVFNFITDHWEETKLILAAFAAYWVTIKAAAAGAAVSELGAMLLGGGGAGASAELGPALMALGASPEVIAALAALPGLGIIGGAIATGSSGIPSEGGALADQRGTSSGSSVNPSSVLPGQEEQDAKVRAESAVYYFRTGQLSAEKFGEGFKTASPQVQQKTVMELAAAVSDGRITKAAYDQAVSTLGIAGFTGGVNFAAPGAMITMDTATGQIVATTGNHTGAANAGGSATAVAFATGMWAQMVQETDPNCNGTIWQAMDTVKKQVGGSLPSAGPLKDGTAAFEGGKALMHKFAEGIRAANTPKAVSEWAFTVSRALQMTGHPQSWIPGILARMQQESGGNPRAINDWDSNAAAGDPSRGLMQTIGSTFAAYHQAGTSWDIFDPLANIAAAINYIASRYGSPYALPVGGYAQGGDFIARQPYLFVAGEAGAERVTVQRLDGKGFQAGGQQEVHKHYHQNTFPNVTTIEQTDQEIANRTRVKRSSSSGRLLDG